MNFKTLSVSALTLALLASSCGPKVTQEEHDNFILLHQKGGKSISYCPESGVQLLYDKGYAFKDLNKNGKLDIYEDWRMSPEDPSWTQWIRALPSVCCALPLTGSNSGTRPFIPSSARPYPPCGDRHFTSASSLVYLIILLTRTTLPG